MCHIYHFKLRMWHETLTKGGGVLPMVNRSENITNIKMSFLYILILLYTINLEPSYRTKTDGTLSLSVCLASGEVQGKECPCLNMFFQRKKKKKVESLKETYKRLDANEK